MSTNRRFPFASVALALLVFCAFPGSAGADADEREFAIGLAAHLMVSIGQSCTRDSDVVECQDFAPFAGADLTAHWWLFDFLAVGARVAGSKDLDSSEDTSSDGASLDPEDQWLWRICAEARLDPPILPSGLWVGAELGVAVLREIQQHQPADSEISEDAASRGAALLGLGLGWDFWLGESFTLTPELRCELIAFDDPPELRPDVEGRDYGMSTWLDVALRLAYAF